MRKSLRIQAQADPSSTLTKAKKRARNKDAGNHSGTGIPLVTNFPYQRLTLEQISNLFRIYKIQLGKDADEATTMIQNIQKLRRASFETYLHSLIDKSKTLDTSQVLVLTPNDLPVIDSDSLKAADSEIFHDTIETLDSVLDAGEVLVSQ